MRAFKNIGRARGIVRRGAALLSVLALVSQGHFAGSAGAELWAANNQPQETNRAARLSEEQRILHVLNRLGFGARPGDVERVRRIGVERYIEEQLQPSKLDDAVAEAKLKNLPTLSLSTGQLLARYPNPGALLRQLQRQGKAPAELATLRDARRSGADEAKPKTQQPAAQINDAESEKMSAGAMTPPAAGAGPAANDASADEARRAYRRALAEYMRENGLENPQRIMAELHASRILRAVYSERQLQEVLVDFWTNHFNVFMGKGVDRWFLTSYDRDVIRPHALGKFRDLLEATAKSPAMLFYLDNFQSVSPNNRRLSRQEREQFLEQLSPEMRERLEGLGGGGRRRGLGGMRRLRQQQRRETGEMAAGAGSSSSSSPNAQPRQQRRPKRGLNENYARELMELHTLGVEGGYTQKDVQEVARCFTGWTLLDPRGYARTDEDGGRFIFNPRLHDDGEKTVLGQRIPAGGGIRDGQLVLDILARHPSTAKFIATKLARRFVADNPDPALVSAVAASYTRSDGDIRETLRALFASPQFNSTEARRAKIKTPFEVAVSAIRALGGETNGSPQLHQWIARMGEPLYGYQAPTGYPDTAADWVNTGALLERLNFALALAANRIPGTRVDLKRFAGEEAAPGRAVEQERLVDRFLALILQGDISPKSRAVLMKQLGEQAAAPAPTSEEISAGRGARRAQRARQMEMAAAAHPEAARIAALILGSPEFQRQ
jgi:uncharacterized protein (DUF1800 family)